jgi:peptidoglycan hydrolase-like protein with peptidoglycan-binding domain
MSTPKTREEWAAHFRAVSKAKLEERKASKSDSGIKSRFGVEPAAVIQQAQAKLNSLGYGPLTVDGIAGPMTQAATKRFQSDKGLTADGIIGPQTLGALGISAGAVVQQTTLPPFNPVLQPSEAAQAINKGYQEVVGQVPSKEILGLMMGQTALETANWTKMPNYNFGGIKASSHDSYIQVFDTTEVINGVTTPMKQTFAAYKSAADGAAAYVKTLMSRQNWWNGLHSGTPQGFVAGLTTQPAYFTADPAGYLAGLQSRMNSYLALAEQYAVPISSAINKIGMIVGAIGLTLGGIAGALHWKGII